MKLFRQNDKRYVWSTKSEAFKPMNNAPAVKHGGVGSVMLWDCFAASVTGRLHNVYEIMKKEDDL